MKVLTRHTRVYFRYSTIRGKYLEAIDGQNSSGQDHMICIHKQLRNCKCPYALTSDYNFVLPNSVAKSMPSTDGSGNYRLIIIFQQMQQIKQTTYYLKKEF